ncbi:MAG: PHP-associated domain-containing protein [Actinomycetota bacterium]|nr:PHP domain-containing protein [Actinomycetota bacterium]
MRADLHTHALSSSRDSRMTVAVLAEAASAAGLEAIAITDHLPGTDFAAAERECSERGITLIPGREVGCALGHVLVFSTDRGWLAALPPVVELPLVGDRNGPVAFVWAHPAGWRVGGAMAPPEPSRGASFMHGIEMLNGERLWQDRGVEIARSLCDELGLAACGGSDAHDAGSVGRCLTEAPEASDALSFIEALMAGAVRPVLSKRWAAANNIDYQRADLIGSLE